MNAKHALLTSFVAVSSLAGCAAGGSSPGPSGPHYPGSASKTAADGGDYEAPAAEYQQPGAMPSPAAPPGAALGGGAGLDEGGVDAAPMEDRAARRDEDPFQLQPESERPGLATQWGEQRSSRVTSAPFVRADFSHPFTVGKLFYNDPSGVSAMARNRGGAELRTTIFPMGDGFLEMGLRDGSGRFLSGFVAGGDNFVAGRSGHRYTIVVKNQSPGRVEAVVSVDGLDVVDGSPAAFDKRGYLLEPFGEVEIEGFRTSTSEVAAFRFGSVASSYAEKKHGDSRNVGVIGLAVFHERGDSPRRWGRPRRGHDVARREQANPFPRQFATP